MKKDIVEDYTKQFKKLFEYSFYTPTIGLNEDGEEDMKSPDQQNSMNNQPPPIQDAAPQSDLPQDSQIPVDQNVPQEPMGDMGEEEIEDIEIDDDNVEEIEVTDLTDAQEQTNTEIQSLNDKFQEFSNFSEKLIQRIDAIVDKSDATEQQIKDLEQEIIKRNPTNTEKLNLRSKDSAPFDEPIADYWNKKVKEKPNYDIISNNEPNVDGKEYVLTQSDIDNYPVNNIEMYKTFDDDFNKNLSNILGY